MRVSDSGVSVLADLRVEALPESSKVGGRAPRGDDSAQEDGRRAASVRTDPRRLLHPVKKSCRRDESTVVSPLLVVDFV